jgi:predicted alpha/beta superfamily hydrolase
MRRSIISILPFILGIACGGSSSNMADSGMADSGVDSGVADSGVDSMLPSACVRDAPAPGGITVNTDTPRFVFVDDFPSTSLGNARTLRVFLPASYDSAQDASYPVIYMHDGQNLFDPATAAFGREWQVDETIDQLVEQGLISEVIVVGIDNTPDRINELTPTEDPDFSGPGGEKGGKGPLYGKFLIEEVKPYVDSHYRTLCGAEHTAVMGSSLGGLISVDIGWRYPDVFGKVGALSPSFWWNDQDTLARLEQASESAAPATRFWIDSGLAEENDDRDGDRLIDVVDDSRDVRDRLIALGHGFGAAAGATLGGLEVPDGAHDEDSWAARFDSVLLYLFATGSEPALTGVDVTTYGDQLALTGPTRDRVLQLGVTATYENGLRMTVPNADVELVVADTGIADVNAGGVISGVAAGATTVRASLGGRTSDDVSFEVVDAFSPTVRVTFNVAVPEDTPADKIVTLAGNLNNWQPSVDSFPLVRVDATHWSAAFDLPRGDALQFKLTLQPSLAGDAWSYVEKGAACEEIANRQLTADADKTYEATVLNWRNVAPCGN